MFEERPTRVTAQLPRLLYRDITDVAMRDVIPNLFETTEYALPNLAIRYA